MKIVDLLLTPFTLDEVIDHAGVQWPRTIKRQHSNDVLESVGLKLSQKLFHAIRFHLKDCSGVGIAQHLVGRRIIKPIKLAQGERTAGMQAIDVIHCHLNDGQVTQPQKVKLHQAGGLDIIFVVHRDNAFVSLGSWRLIERAEIR